jgi:adenosylcobinamide-GDP ribazoletransferase
LRRRVLHHWHEDLAVPAIAMLSFLRHYLLAIQFFTRIPVTGRLAQWVGYSPAMLRASAAHFPGIGWLVGAVCAGLAVGLQASLPASPLAGLVAAVLVTMASALLTGAFHEDGLADVADGLGGSLERSRALDIMKDSRIGTFGALALMLVLLLKLASLALLWTAAPLLMAWALFAAHVASRFYPLLLVRSMRHVGDEGSSKSKPLADQIASGSLFVALLWTMAGLALVFTLAPAVPLPVPLLASTLTCLVLWRWFNRRLQGFTGDCLGATQQLCESAFYLGLVMCL